MNGSNTKEVSKRRELLEKFISQLTDPFHKRLIQAYESDEPVSAMESELRTILMEILSDED